jgi:uncharacterized protein DUF4124
MDARNRRTFLQGLALLAALAATGAAAQTLYKLIDRNGKVTYSESPPKDFDGKVIRMDIDPKANTATLPKAGTAPRPETESEKVIRRPTPATGAADPVEAARARLEAARKALQDAIDNPREGEIERRGNVGGGSRPVPSEEYENRLAALKADVAKAEEELRLAEKNR